MERKPPLWWCMGVLFPPRCAGRNRPTRTSIDTRLVHVVNRCSWHANVLSACLLYGRHRNIVKRVSARNIYLQLAGEAVRLAQRPARKPLAPLTKGCRGVPRLADVSHGVAHH